MPRDEAKKIDPSTWKCGRGGRSSQRVRVGSGGSDMGTFLTLPNTTTWCGMTFVLARSSGPFANLSATSSCSVSVVEGLSVVPSRSPAGPVVSSLTSLFVSRGQRTGEDQPLPRHYVKYIQVHMGFPAVPILGRWDLSVRTV